MSSLFVDFSATNRVGRPCDAGDLSAARLSGLRWNDNPGMGGYSFSDAVACLGQQASMTIFEMLNAGLEVFDFRQAHALLLPLLKRLRVGAAAAVPMPLAFANLTARLETVELSGAVERVTRVVYGAYTAYAGETYLHLTNAPCAILERSTSYEAAMQYQDAWSDLAAATSLSDAESDL